MKTMTTFRRKLHIIWAVLRAHQWIVLTARDNQATYYANASAELIKLMKTTMRKAQNKTNS